MITIHLGLGTNLGDRRSNIASGISLLGPKVYVEQVSSVYETEPVGVLGQPSFLNVVLRGRTRLSPIDLLSLMEGVACRVGRRPTYRWGPRVLDIDILLYGEQTVDEPNLQIPHREMLNRAFVLIPLCEISPDVTMPNGESICVLVADPVITAQSVKLGGPPPFP